MFLVNTTVDTICLEVQVLVAFVILATTYYYHVLQKHTRL